MIEYINKYLTEQFGDEGGEEEDQQNKDQDITLKSVSFDPEKIGEYHEHISDQFEDVDQKYRDSVKLIYELNLHPDRYDDVWHDNMKSAGKLFQWLKDIRENYPLNNRNDTDFEVFATPVLSQYLDTISKRKTLGERGQGYIDKLKSIKDNWDNVYSLSEIESHIENVDKDLADVFRSIQSLESEFERHILDKLKGESELSDRDWYDIAVEGDLKNISSDKE